MLNMRPFEIILIGIFALSAFGGLIYFAVRDSAPDATERPYGTRVIMWGTFPSMRMNEILSKAVDVDRNLQVVDYVEKDPRTFQSELQASLAEGNPPDLIVLPHQLLVSNQRVLLTLSYAEYPERSFRDTYVDGASIFMFSDGIYGIPFAVDPLVMYWNRDLFSAAGLPNPPRTWEALIAESVPALTKRNVQYELVQSAVGLGEYINVNHAKDILSMLLLQAGSTIVSEQNGKYVLTLNNQTSKGGPPAEAVLSFYTQFASPSSATYTWNRSQQLDRDKFLGGSLALYLGFGTEYQELLRSNPNLYFDVTSVPQGSNVTTQRNYGIFYGFALPRSSNNPAGAKKVALQFSTPSIASIFVDVLNLAPVHRVLIANRPSDPIKSVLFQTSLISQGWLDPSPQESNDIFRSMVEEVTSGKARTSQAVNDAVKRLQVLFR